LSHLLFEAALARKEMPLSAGRTFVVTDPGPSLAFEDLYKLVTELSVTTVSVARLPPLLLLLVAHGVEAYVWAVTRFPFLAKLGLKEPRYPLSFLQPSAIYGSMHTLADDSAIRRSVEDGGLGYRGVCTSLEGMCEELVEWNREHDGA